ncbi:MAG: galactose-1-phosphate uridylyltransferase [Candidatus Altiarchaeota archaeon]|nr:galactose-1-phosphate uridylyltransferase [Candidatus Altiarchaeota archaeon]
MEKNSIRKDFLIDRYAIIAEGRGSRPVQFEKNNAESVGKVCFFCPGNEHLTPPEITRTAADIGNGWSVRVFSNKFPALQPPEGSHEIIVDTNRHGVELGDMPEGDIRSLFEMYEQRRIELEKEFMYVSIFKNKGREAGASLSHSHSQLIAMYMLPHLVAKENEKAEQHYYTKGSCPFCDYISTIDKKRVAFETDSVIAITPNAPRYPYELWIFPKKHVANFSGLDDNAKSDFLSTLKKALKKLDKLSGSPPYNFYLHNSPKGSERWYHFHLELLPRLSTYAGFELGSEVYICTVPPDMAAQFYREDI